MALEAHMSDPRRDVQINISSIPVAGIGGLGLVVMAAAIAVVFPLVRWVVIGGAAGGALLGSAIIFLRRRRPPDTSGDPFAGRLSPLKPTPKDLRGSVALEEPDEEHR
jgi:hypothetical protein